MKTAVFLLLAISCSAAVRTSTASGNWSAGGTWVGGVAPGIGDTAIIATGTTVTVNGTITVGTSGAVGTAAITIQGTGQLTGAAAAVLNSRGDIVGPQQANNVGSVTGSNAWTINMDCSVGGATHYAITSAGAGNWTLMNASNLTMTTNCTYADLGYEATRGATQGNGIVCDHCNFTKTHITVTPFTGITQSLNITKSHLTTSWIEVSGTVTSAFTLNLNTLLFDGSATYNFAAGMNGGVEASCTITHIVADSSAVWGVGQYQGASDLGGCTIDDALLRGTISTNAGVGATLKNSISLLQSPNNLQGFVGNMDTVWGWTVNHDGTHSHTWDMPGQSSTYNKVFIASSVNQTGSNDGFVDPGTPTGDGKTYTFSKGVLLQQPNGLAVGSFLDHRCETTDVLKFGYMVLSAATNSNGAISAECEQAAHNFGTGGYLRNTMYWNPTPANNYYALNTEVQNAGFNFPMTDPFANGFVGPNAMWNVKRTGTPTCPHGCTNTNGYLAGAWTWTPGTTDVAGNPSLVDYTRSPENFAGRYLYPKLSLSAPAQWATSTSYTVGQVVRDTNANNPFGLEVYYRCIQAHTSSGANEPGASWNNQATWWTYWSLETIEKIADLINAGTTISDGSIGCTNCTGIQALSNWILVGLTPQLPAYYAFGPVTPSMGITHPGGVWKVAP